MRTVAIDRDRCDGCGLCVSACHEGVIELANGKAVVSKPWLCDGIGDCLPACPADAISFVESGMTVPIGLSADGPQWPVKLELVAERNPAFDGKDLLVAADCSAFKADVVGEYGGGALVIGCPKLSKVDERKLASIISGNDVRSVTVVRMMVPCCSPLASKAEYAVRESGKDIPFRVVVLGRDGKPQ